MQSAKWDRKMAKLYVKHFDEFTEGLPSAR
jgi:hypothetical protein